MARIQPVRDNEISPSLKAAFEKHVSDYNARITNMKGTLGHSQLAFEVYMQWYLLYDAIEKILGKRMAYLYAYSISYATDCPLCTTFFRKLIIDAGEKPESLELTPNEQDLLDFGNCIAKHHGNIADHIYNRLATQFNNEELILLIAFAGQMVATNVLNNVLETNIDEYLVDYLPSLKYH